MSVLTIDNLKTAGSQYEGRRNRTRTPTALTFRPQPGPFMRFQSKYDQGAKKVAATPLTPTTQRHNQLKLFLKSPDTDEALCEPKDFVDAIVNVEDEYFLEPYVENVVPW